MGQDRIHNDRDRVKTLAVAPTNWMTLPTRSIPVGLADLEASDFRIENLTCPQPRGHVQDDGKTEHHLTCEGRK